MTKIGVVQMNSGTDPERNLSQIKKFMQGLQLQGAKLVVTPENSVVFGSKADYQRWAEPLGSGPLQQQLSQYSQQLGLWLLIGSMPILQADGSITTTSVLFDDQGKIHAHYNKMHMFDVNVADKHHSYRESDTFKAGDDIKVIDTPFGKLGLSICYDLRFPQLYGELRQQGADIIIIPAAFTKLTGRAHWEILVRARAIETQCWVVAAAQSGDHSETRETWGHSMIVDPWGQVVACQQQGTGVLTANVDLQLAHKIRTNMPVADHARLVFSHIQ